MTEAFSEEKKGRGRKGRSKEKGNSRGISEIGTAGGGRRLELERWLGVHLGLGRRGTEG